jgi:hypothetical protein
MKEEVAVFKQKNKKISVLIPTQEALEKFSIMFIAKKDIPKGLPFKIVNYKDLPWHIPQEAWEIEDKYLTDGFGENDNL